MLSSSLSSLNYQDAFNGIDCLLVQFQPIWRESPFTQDHPSWLSDHGELADALQNLSDDELEELEDESNLIAWTQNFLPELALLERWQIAPGQAPLLSAPKFSDVGIPGRKLTQIMSFTSAVTAGKSPAGPIIDWCSGKGHLARQLHFASRQRVLALEYDPKLCEQGTLLNQQQQADVSLIKQDVLDPALSLDNSKVSLHTALHACGDLHKAMLSHACRHHAPQIALSPCCYHLTKEPHYQALSRAGQNSELTLTRSQLRLAVMETVTGGERVKRLRQQELLWRTGYDLLQRQLTGCDRYQPTPSINKAQLSGTFEDYCIKMAHWQQLSLPGEVDFQDILHRAGQKLARIQRLEKARLGFRKALEWWLLLDRVLYLEEQGYRVEMSQFCERGITPRNTLIQAWRD